MDEVPGLVCKVGAEGLHCAAVLGAGIGIAVKVADGSDRAAAPALVRTLDLLEVIDDEQRVHLASLGRPAVLGGGGPVGELVAGFRLRRPRG
jgi:L-asparaginase II